MLLVASRLQCSVARICALTDGSWLGGVAACEPDSGMLIDMVLTPPDTGVRSLGNLIYL